MNELSINDPIFSDLSETFKRNVKNGNIKLVKGLKKAVLLNVMYSDPKNNIYGIRMNNHQFKKYNYGLCICLQKRNNRV